MVLRTLPTLGSTLHSPLQVQSALTEMTSPTLFLSEPAMTCTVSPVYTGMGCLMGLPFLFRG